LHLSIVHPLGDAADLICDLSQSANGAAYLLLQFILFDDKSVGAFAGPGDTQLLVGIEHLTEHLLFKVARQLIQSISLLFGVLEVEPDLCAAFDHSPPLK